MKNYAFITMVGLTFNIGVEINRYDITTSVVVVLLLASIVDGQTIYDVVKYGAQSLLQ